MAGQLGRILVGGRDRGAGFALGPRLVVTAHHVVRDRDDQPVVYVPAGGEAVGVGRVEPDVGHDAAILWLVSDVGEFFPTSAAVRGAKWQVESPPAGGNDPRLHGTIATARMTIQNANRQPVDVVQLEVDEQLGDFGGYSGGAVLDALGRAVLALLVEQKPLRTPVALGERRAASNVLYAVPIGDVITANGLPVQAARPLRFGVGLLPPGMVMRPGLLDEAVGQVIGTEGGEVGAGLVVLRGPGGVGKTVLARQVADDVRVWAEFTDGIVMLRAGQGATADGVARQLQETLGYRDRHLADVLAGHRLLLIVDDVWDRELLGTLRASLAPTVTVLATTRGVSVPGAVAVSAGAVGREEAIEILARGIARGEQLDRAFAGLAETLFRWPLLLTLAAAEIHRDDELSWGLGDDDNSPSDGTESDVLIDRAEALRAEFPGDPTMLDELEHTGEGPAPRSVEVLVRRSLDWLGLERRARFELLAIYLPGAVITRPMLDDLWETSPNATRKEIKLLARAGVAQPVRGDGLTIELHDLITAWLHHKHGRPDDARHQPVHQRLAGLCMLGDGSPGELTRDRAEWLAHHLVAAGAWDRLKALPTAKWRSAFQVATGSDAVFLAALDHYGHAALAQAPDALYHAVRAWLFAAHVRALIGELPIPVLMTMAVVGDPIAVITQAGQHPRAGWAIPAVLRSAADRLDTRFLIERALAVAGTIPDAQGRGGALAGIAERLASVDPVDPALIERAVALAETIPDPQDRSGALAGIAERLAVIDPAWTAALIERAAAVAGTILDYFERGRALAGIAERLASVDPVDPALIERAVALAETIPDPQDRSGALAGIAERLAVIDPAWTAALIERAAAVAGTIPRDHERSWALAGIVQKLAGVDPVDPALIERALAVAETIPYDWRRSDALAGIAGRLAVIDPVQAAALIERAVAVAGTIADPQGRSDALAGIAGRLAGVDPVDRALIERALAVAETIPYDWRRSDALAGIARRLAVIDPVQAAALIERAWGMTGTFPGDQKRIGTLATIAERLAGADPRDPVLLERAVAVAGRIPRDEGRSNALDGIVRKLAGVDPVDPALIERAVAVAGTIPNNWQRGWTLTAIVRRLAGVDPVDPALIERAVEVADTVPGDFWRTGALADIAERLAVIDPARAAALIERAVAVAGTIPGDQERSGALAGIAERLAGVDPVDPALIERAVAVAGTIPGDQERSGALAGIAERLAVIDPARAAALIERAVAVAGTIPGDQERSGALAGIAERLAGVDPVDPALIERAVAVAGTIPGDQERSGALAGIAERLAGVDPVDPALIERALAVADAAPDDQARGRALAAVAGRLAGAVPGDPALIERALAVAETISDDQARGGALAGIAVWLAAAGAVDPALIERAVAVAEAISDDQARGGALAGIAGRLAAIDPPRAGALIEQALAVAETIPGEEQYSATLAAIVERLAGVDPVDPALIERALAVAETISDDQARGGALAAIAGRLATAARGDSALIERVIAVAETIPGDFGRGGALAAVAGRLAGAARGDQALIERAVAVAEAISDDQARGGALAAVAGRLAGAARGDPALIEQALAVTQTISDDRQRSEVAARIHALTRRGMLAELARWRLWPLSTSIDLVNVFLGNSHDKPIAESIGLAVLDASKEFPAKT